jgi:hypothetical protein
MEEFKGQHEWFIQGYLAACRDFQIMIYESAKGCNSSVLSFRDGLIHDISDIVHKQREKNV